MNVLVPIGGRDRYFREEDFAFPKPLIDINGLPMIEHVVDNLKSLGDPMRFTFVVQDEDCRQFSLDRVLQIVAGDATIVKLRAPTQGAICSCLMAVDAIDPDEELIIANSDQIVRTDLAARIDEFRLGGLDAAVLTFDSTHPRFCYARLDQDGRVIETSEKQVISRHAVVGLYYFRRGEDFIRAAKQVLLNDSPLQGRYFISQAMNELILEGAKVGHRPLPVDSYFNLFSPQKVSDYEARLIAEARTVPSTAPPPVLLIPMAGEGRRFIEAGYPRPKPFIDILGKTMIERVLENLDHRAFRTVAVVNQQHLQDPVHRKLLRDQKVDLVLAQGLTEGTACTLMLARAKIDPEAPVLVANCDQIVDFECRDFVEDCLARGLDGSILVFRDAELNPKWSFARINPAGLVVEVREKQPISDLATVGLYFFSKGRYLIEAALDMIAHNDRVNGEFYTAPVYNYMIRSGLRVGVFEVPAEAMHGLGIPADLESYQRHIAERGQHATG